MYTSVIRNHNAMLFLRIYESTTKLRNYKLRLVFSVLQIFSGSYCFVQNKNLPDLFWVPNFHPVSAREYKGQLMSIMKNKGILNAQHR